MWDCGEAIFFESVLQAMGDGVIIANGAGSVYYANPRARELIGIRESDGESIPSLRRLSPEIFSQLKAISQGSTRIAHVTINYPERRLLRVTYLLCDPIANLHAIIMADITAEAAEREANLESETLEAVSSFAAGIAHEIGNPVNTIKIHLQLLQRGLGAGGKNADLASYAGICLEELDRIDHIIAYFLRAVRPAIPQFKELLLSECLRHCQRILAAELRELNISFHLEVSGQSPEDSIMGDEEQLRQVFFNLLRNSMEAMEGGGEIAVRIGQTNRREVVEICDSGAGIPVDSLQRVFNPYYTTKKDGNGLGLVIVQRILRAHGATFSLEACRPKGTRFLLYFPKKNPRLPMLEFDQEVQNLDPFDGEDIG
jgi:signal transduction histidine kinase